MPITNVKTKLCKFLEDNDLKIMQIKDMSVELKDKIDYKTVWSMKKGLTEDYSIKSYQKIAKAASAILGREVVISELV